MSLALLLLASMALAQVTTLPAVTATGAAAVNAQALGLSISAKELPVVKENEINTPTNLQSYGIVKMVVVSENGTPLADSSTVITKMVFSEGKDHYEDLQRHRTDEKGVTYFLVKPTIKNEKRNESFSVGAGHENYNPRIDNGYRVQAGQTLVITLQLEPRNHPSVTPTATGPMQVPNPNSIPLPSVVPGTDNVQALFAQIMAYLKRINALEQRISVLEKRVLELETKLGVQYTPTPTAASESGTQPNPIQQVLIKSVQADHVETPDGVVTSSPSVKVAVKNGVLVGVSKSSSESKPIPIGLIRQAVEKMVSNPTNLQVKVNEQNGSLVYTITVQVPSQNFFTKWFIPLEEKTISLPADTLEQNPSPLTTQGEVQSSSK